MIRLTVMALFISAVNVHAHEGEMSASVGRGKAIEAADEERGFKLSEKAFKRLGVESVPAAKPLPREALLRTLDTTSFYRLRAGWISRQGVHATSFEAGDRVIVSPVGLVRMAELEAGLDDPHDEHQDEHEH